METSELNHILSTLKNIEPVIDVEVDCGKLLRETSHIADVKKRMDEVAALIDMKSGTHPAYGRLAGRLLSYTLNTYGRIAGLTFSERMERIHDIHKNDPKYTRRIGAPVLAFIRQHRKILDAVVKYDKEDYHYFGAITARKVYLGFHDGQHTESIQDFHMRVAVQIAVGVRGRRSTDRLSVCLAEYRDLSQQKRIYATPINTNSGYDEAQLSSCFLVYIKDSIDGIYGSLWNCAKIHAKMGGCAICVQDIRSVGSVVSSTGGAAAGLVAFAKNFDHTSSIVMAGGRRSGSNAGWFEPHHMDILDVLTSRTMAGDETSKMRTLFQGMFIPDLFMRRVFEQEDADWYLFDPSSFPGLGNVHNAAFDKLYAEYEEKAATELEKEGAWFTHQASGVPYFAVPGRCARVKAVDIWNATKTEISENSVPFLIAKDAVNRRSQHDNRGPVRMSNLCTEIFEYVDENETAVCTLGNVCLPAYVTTNGFNYEELHAVTKRLCWGLNSVLDTQVLPLPSAKLSNDTMRSIGIGLQGFADVCIKLGLSYDEPAARILNRQIAETIYHAALEASCELAEDTQPYPHFKTNGGSYLAKGLFHHEVDGTYPHPLLWDWEPLRQRIRQFGVANSLVTAIAPTSTTAIMQGNQESFQALVSNMVSRSTLAGDFCVINEHLVRDLEALGLWNEETRSSILESDGSVKNLPISRKLKDVYRTAFEISGKSTVEMLRDRAWFVDQGQSFNLFAGRNVDLSSFLDSAIYYSWRIGNANLMYYLRQEPKTEALRVSVSTDITASTSRSNSPASTKSEDARAEVCMRQEGCLVCQ